MFWNWNPVECNPISAKATTTAAGSTVLANASPTMMMMAEEAPASPSADGVERAPKRKR